MARIKFVSVQQSWNNKQLKPAVIITTPGVQHFLNQGATYKI
jgi:hypothetical protein